MRETFNEWMDICLNPNINTRMRISPKGTQKRTTRIIKQRSVIKNVFLFFLRQLQVDKKQH